MKLSEHIKNCQELLDKEGDMNVCTDHGASGAQDEISSIYCKTYNNKRDFDRGPIPDCEIIGNKVGLLYIGN